MGYEERRESGQCGLEPPQVSLFMWLFREGLLVESWGHPGWQMGITEAFETPSTGKRALYCDSCVAFMGHDQ